MGERYVDVGKVRSRSGPLRSVRASAHSARSQPPPQPPLTASAHFAVSFTEIGHTPARNRFKGLSGHSPVGLHQPRRDSPRPQEAPGRPTSTDINRYRHAAERSARGRQAGLSCARRATERAHRAEHPAVPPPPQFLYQGSPPRSLSETARVRSRACRIFRFTPASAIDTASCRSS